MNGSDAIIDGVQRLNLTEEFYNPLTRLDDTLFAFCLKNERTQEACDVFVQTPFFGDNAIAKAHALAFHFFSACKEMSRAEIENVKRMDVTGDDVQLCTSWNVAKVVDSVFAKHTTQTIPMFHNIHDRRVLHLSLSPPGNILSRSVSFWKSGTIIQSREAIQYPSIIECEFFADSLEQHLEMPAFGDPFTRLAIRAFEVYEPRFVSQLKPFGALRYVVRENMLALVPVLSEEEGNAAEQNRAVIALYRDFLVQEYGKEFLNYIEGAYGFCLTNMIREGSPLYPDHVFKINVGVNNIELCHVENLYKKLYRFVHTPPKLSGNSCREYILSMAHAGFSLREMRALEALFYEKPRRDSLGALQEFFKEIVGNAEPSQEAFHYLPVRSMNALISTLMPPENYLDNIFTGRRINHLAICGYPTMGDSSVTDPCRDLFELLHVFPAMAKKEAAPQEDGAAIWFHWKELLAHVAVKKTLIRKYYKEEKDGEKAVVWRVGTLLPAPTAQNETQRWYYVASAIDDDDGNVNYVLLPVSENYQLHGKPLPAIKLYRSTASNKNAYDSYDSLAADLNPRGGPGSLDPLRAFPFERNFFDTRTIPVWVGYCIQAQAINGQEPDGMEKKVAALKNALKEYVNYLKDLRHEIGSEEGEHKRIVEEMLVVAKEKRDQEALDADKTIEFLFEAARKLEEHPEQKNAQDIVFVGHSLGGSLAQFGFYFWGAERERILLPQHNFECFALDAPAITPEQDTTVRDFTTKHQDLLEALGQKWKIWYQFEYGDIVPQAGERHLGTTKNYQEKCVQVSARVFRPAEDSQALEITTLPTHGRRIGLARADQDYTLTMVDAPSLRAFHGMRLSADLKKIFGYKVLTGPQITDVIRRIAGVPLIPFLQLAERIHEKGLELPGHRPGTEVFYAAINDPQEDVVRT